MELIVLGVSSVIKLKCLESDVQILMIFSTCPTWYPSTSNIGSESVCGGTRTYASGVLMYYSRVDRITGSVFIITLITLYFLAGSRLTKVSTTP